MRLSEGRRCKWDYDITDAGYSLCTVQMLRCTHQHNWLYSSNLKKPCMDRSYYIIRKKNWLINSVERMEDCCWNGLSLVRRLPIFLASALQLLMLQEIAVRSPMFNMCPMAAYSLPTPGFRNTLQNVLIGPGRKNRQE